MSETFDVYLISLSLIVKTYITQFLVNRYIYSRVHVWTEEKCRLCSLALSRRYSILVAVRSHSGVDGSEGVETGGRGTGGGGESVVKPRLSAPDRDGRAGSGKGVRTGTRVVVRLEKPGLVRVERAGRRPVRDRSEGLLCRNELGNSTNPAF